MVLQSWITSTSGFSFESNQQIVCSGLKYHQHILNQSHALISDE